MSEMYSWVIAGESQNAKYILERSRACHDNINARRNAKIFFCKYGASEIFAELVEFVNETQYRYLENVHK